MIYDFILIGSGISSLNLALKIKQKILIIEKNDYFGGRIRTIYKNKLGYEAGAARFNNNHIKLIHLLKKYKLYKNISKIPSEWTDVNTYNIKDFKNINDFIQDVIKNASLEKEKDLLKLTFAEYVEKKYGKKYLDFVKAAHPYYSEFFVLNLKNTLNVLIKDLNESEQFYILKTGLSSLVKEIVKDLKNKKVELKKNTYLQDIEYNKTKQLFTCICLEDNVKKEFQCKNLISGIDVSELKQIHFFKQLKELNALSTQPLLRIYEQYPLKNKKVWFENSGKVVTSSNIKYFIPIDYSNGLVMSSYTDGNYAKFWLKQMEKENLEIKLNKELKLLFPEKKITKPLFTEIYYWPNGASYWKKGYDSEKILKKIIKPFNMNLYLCNSNFSNKQAWIEGALESSDNVFDLLSNTKNVKLLKKSSKVKKGGSKKTKKKNMFTMDDIKKHNKINDAYTVIDGKVLDITDFLKKHPGGLLSIKQIIGKDGTQKFKNSLGHTVGGKVRKSIMDKMKKYIIGELKK